MPFSIWEYLRERTRDAVLSGFQDALDIAEQGDTEGSQHAAANRLRARLANGSPTVPSLSTAETTPTAAEPVPLSHPSINGKPAASHQPTPRVAAEKAPTRPAGVSTFDDELESRLAGNAAENGRATPQMIPQTGRRRGRPAKKSEGRP